MMLQYGNGELKNDEKSLLISTYVIGSKASESPVSLRSMILDLRTGDIGPFITRLESLFISIPYPEWHGPAYEQEWRNQVS